MADIFINVTEIHTNSRHQKTNFSRGNADKQFQSIMWSFMSLNLMKAINWESIIAVLYYIEEHVRKFQYSF